LKRNAYRKLINTGRLRTTFLRISSLRLYQSATLTL
jgi:hypothetical protein